jgi:DNA repair exonuclease SbcCD nuclease subunit/predicted GIY-YIG superfamily endonuclease
VAQPLRILHTADSHIGADWPDRPRTDRARRGDDILANYQRVLTAAVQQQVDLVLHAGDLFDRPNPGARLLTAAAEPLLKAAVAGIPVVIVPGNHERSSIPANVLLSHPNIHVLTTPATRVFRLRGLSVAVSGFACLRRDAANRFTAAVAETGWEEVPAAIRILLVHQTFESAACGPAGFRFRPGDDVVERAAVPDAFHYVASGHVHRHQALVHPSAAGPPIVYAGSPDRIHFAEIGEPKGYVRIEADGHRLTHTFVEHLVRPMVIRPMDVSGVGRAALVEHVESILRSLPKAAVAQLRMTGQAHPDLLRGLGLTQMARRLRPDVRFSVVTSGIQRPVRTPRPAVAASPGTAFDVLEAPAVAILRCTTGNARHLPRRAGVYALHDAAGRLLYVGKAQDVRARIRTHLHDTDRSNFFRGWAQQVARVEVRPVDGDLEALLVEAELIRRWQPPFNRHMRRWTEYCYLVEDGRPFGALHVSPRPDPRRPSFGPFRSRRAAEAIQTAAAALLGLALCPPGPRHNPLPAAGGARLCERFFAGQCSGPCAGRISPADYAQRTGQQHALLSGTDDAPLRRLESMPASAEDEARVQDAQGNHPLARLLRAAFDHTVMLNQAERLRHGLLLLPARPGVRKVAVLGDRAVRFDVLENDLADAGRLVTRWRAAVAGETNSPRLAVETVDALLIVARALRCSPAGARYVGSAALPNWTPAALLREAFGQTARLQPTSPAPVTR